MWWKVVSYDEPDKWRKLVGCAPPTQLSRPTHWLQGPLHPFQQNSYIQVMSVYSVHWTACLGVPLDSILYRNMEQQDCTVILCSNIVQQCCTTILYNNILHQYSTTIYYILQQYNTLILYNYTIQLCHTTILNSNIVHKYFLLTSSNWYFDINGRCSWRINTVSSI